MNLKQMWGSRKNNLDQIVSFILNSEAIKIEKSDKEELIKMIKPTIGIKTKSCNDNNVKVGKSKIGGKPDLPKDFNWPTSDNKSMSFCAQYNLSELTKLDKENVLPDKGFFYIFISLALKGTKQDFRFIYSESENVCMTEFPEDLEENESFKTALIDYFEYYTIPDDENYKLFHFDKKYHDFNFHFYQPVEEFIIDGFFESANNLHQILGHDRSIQSSVVYEFASKELELYFIDSSEYSKRWNEILELSKTFELLLQLDCDDPNTDLTKFCGDGTYYFGITNADLKNSKFNDIKMSYQST
ncbi:MAG: DUF1963 domain-containing protein [Saprospiraceae bacterium]|nr:DUF1963 domain-containing protein [Saprospiraceae bacterium]